jgi:peptidoglycan-associated lipoprotein
MARLGEPVEEGEIMKKIHTKLLGTFAMAAILSACASTPEPEPEPEVIETPTPEPEIEIFEQPEVIAPPVERPIDVVPVDPNLPVPGSVEDFAYQSGGEPRVFFGYDQFVLSPEARDVLGRQANWLQLYPNATATIEGHADERGTREYNLALGARRANSVQAFLISRGVAPNRLRTLSYGKERPIDARSNEAGWARNRNGYTNLVIGGVS